MTQPVNDFTLTKFCIFYLEHRIGFKLQHWAIKIMSFVISTNRLIMLTQSHHLHKLFDGKFSVQVLTSPTTAPYRYKLSSESIKKALDTALAGSIFLSTICDQKRKLFIKELEASEKDFQKPTVHAELALIMAMVNGKINDMAPYIGVSKLSCIMCNHYIDAFNMVMKQNIAIKGSHRKAYPGWAWPSLPSCDKELRQVFLGLISLQLRRDFDDYATLR